MVKKTTGHEKLWDATLRVADGEIVDFSKFSKEEQLEIKGNLKIIKTLESTKEPSPSKGAFNEFLSDLSVPQTKQQTTHDWGHFFKTIFDSHHRWATLPVMGVLLISLTFWGPKQNEVNLILAEAENLSKEIQRDFVDVSRELEELQELEELFATTNSNSL